MGLRLTQGPGGRPFRGRVTGQIPTWNQESNSWELSSAPLFTTPSSPVFVEKYLQDSSGDLRTAIRSAWLRNPNAAWFIYPAGVFSFVGPMLTLADGLRNGTRHTGQNTILRRDLGGVPTGQNIFFYRSETDGRHADHITFEGFRFELLNALTSFFGFAIGLESASHCVLYDCEAVCTLVPGATQGRLRWGFALFGGDQTAEPTAGTNNRFTKCRLTVSQIQGCSDGRSVDGLIVSDTLVNDSHDYAISVVSTGFGFNVQNVVIRDTVCNGSSGHGVVAVGGDGTSAGAACSILRNVLIDGVVLDGKRATPDTDFTFQNAVLVNGALATENVNVTNIGTSLSPDASGLQAVSVLVQSNDAEVSWNGLTISNCELGVVTTNDPFWGLRVNGRTIAGCSLSNVHVQGQRGVQLINCADDLTVTNVQVFQGSFRVEAHQKNVSGVSLTNVHVHQAAAFNFALGFISTTGKNMSDVQLCNVTLSSTGLSGLSTSLAGGTMQMSIVNLVDNNGGNNPSAETLLGIQRFSNIRGFVVPTLATAILPAIAAGAVEYVTVSLSGTRLGDLFVGEGLQANPAQRLVPSGSGGAYMNCRVSSPGTAELCFLGPLPAGSYPFHFNRTN